MENGIKRNPLTDAPVETKPIHGVLFVLACLALLACFLILSVVGVMLLTYTPGDPEQAGMGEIGVLLGNLAAGFIALTLREIFRPV